MPRPAIQLHTLRNVDEPLPTLLDVVADAGYEGVQPTPRLAGVAPSDLREALAARGLGVAGAHANLEELERDGEATTDRYGSLGADRLVLGSYDPEAFDDADGVDEAASRLRAVGERLASEGFELHYHNHAFEFADLGDGTAYDRFAAGTGESVGLEVDTGLARHAGVDPVDLIDRYADRVSLVHLTDTVPGSEARIHAEPGDGVVDLAACVDAAKRAGVEWVIYENGRTDDPVASARRAGGLLADWLYG